MSQKTKQYIIKSKVRHYRYLFIVDDTYDLDSLQKIMYQNLEFWGGRFNPIVPIVNGDIPNNYLPIIQMSDPDYVFCIESFDIGKLRGLINPKEYRAIDRHGLHNIKGVDSAYLIRHYDQELVLRETGYLYKSKIKNVLPFYKLNFGITSDTYLNYKQKAVVIKDDKIDEINDILSTSNVAYNSDLSGRNAVCNLLVNNKLKNTRLELIIAKDDNQFEDLLYYWNRSAYFESHSWDNNQIFITENQLIELSQDESFHGLLAAMSGTRDIKIHSETVPKKELQSYIDSYLSKYHYVRYFIEDQEKFPFAVNAYRLRERDTETVENQLISGNKGIIEILKPHYFLGEKDIRSQSWVVDVLIEQGMYSDTIRNKIKLPLDTPVNFHFFKQNGRVNKNHDLSIFVDQNIKSIEFKIPDEKSLIHSLLMDREINGQRIPTPIKDVVFSDAGKKLSAFTNIFENNWLTMYEFISDKFWLNLFKFNKNIAKTKSNIPGGRGVFSFMDLEMEMEHIYTEHNTKLTDRFKRDDIRILKNNIQYLMDREGIFIGTKIICHNCGKNGWFGYSELNHIMNCKGCNKVIRPVVEPVTYYKLSEVLINNILSDQTNNKKHFGGNFTVLRTLKKLYDDSKHSFMFCPSTDFYLDLNSDASYGDIDILAIQDGKLILGEAKNSAKEFTKKELKRLAFLGNEVQPSKLILSYNNDQLNPQKIKDLKAMLKFDCEIIEYKLWSSSYYFTGIHGKQLNYKEGFLKIH